MENDMAIMRVDGRMLEHVLDFPESVSITNIEREHAGPEEESTAFVFHLHGKDPESGEDLVGEVNATYFEDDTGVHFGGFNRVE